MLAHMGHILPHQLRRAELPVDPDLARLNFAAMVPAGDHVQQRDSPTACEATRDILRARAAGGQPGSHGSPHTL